MSTTGSSSDPPGDLRDNRASGSRPGSVFLKKKRGYDSGSARDLAYRIKKIPTVPGKGICPQKKLRFPENRTTQSKPESPQDHGWVNG